MPVYGKLPQPHKNQENSMPQTEKDFLKHYRASDYPAPLVTVDMAIFTVLDDQLCVLLVKRAQHPAKGQWALPGGFINLEEDKDLQATAHRKLKEKTGVDAPYLEQVITSGNASRDPRGWSVTIAYFALIANDNNDLIADHSSEEVTWKPISSVESLAFDHLELLAQCHQRLRSKVHYTALPVHLLPATFTLVELQTIFEIILGNKVEKKAFRRRIIDADIIEETGEMRAGVTRPAKLYRPKNNGGNHYFSRAIEGGR